MHLHPEAPLHLGLKVNAAPADHPMFLRVRSRKHERPQLSLLQGRQKWCPFSVATRLKALNPGPISRKVWRSMPLNSAASMRERPSRTIANKRHIERCLRSLAGIAREVVIVDSYSNDRAVEIAERLGARVIQHEFINCAKQFQSGLDNANITSNWVMRLDADEIIEADLAVEMAARLPLLPQDISGVNLKRKHIFMGRWIRHGGRYPLILLRIWRRGKTRIEQRWMDEHMILVEGQSVMFDGGFADTNLNDLTFFTQKHNRYATREAVDVINQRRQLFPLYSESAVRQNLLDPPLIRLPHGGQRKHVLDEVHTISVEPQCSSSSVSVRFRPRYR